MDEWVANLNDYKNNQIVMVNKNELINQLQEQMVELQ